MRINLLEGMTRFKTGRSSFQCDVKQIFKPTLREDITDINASKPNLALSDSFIRVSQPDYFTRFVIDFKSGIVNFATRSFVQVVNNLTSFPNTNYDQLLPPIYLTQISQICCTRYASGTTPVKLRKCETLSIPLLHSRSLAANRVERAGS
ncbi:hypothetical protein BLNAU_1911 [Blattamonas nauphoetae]|uniref:Uncharacterized protein n=1 Tax=Blattamonas nauphoetae TaxID=2049346 RepID=A0ABQ9YGN6_9EUKA|nr:hypothetical protein BLNAU_1911 [Blattamonas nauphoetae]